MLPGIPEPSTYLEHAVLTWIVSLRQICTSLRLPDAGFQGFSFCLLPDRCSQQAHGGAPPACWVMLCLNSRFWGLAGGFRGFTVLTLPSKHVLLRVMQSKSHLTVLLLCTCSLSFLTCKAQQPSCSFRSSVAIAMIGPTKLECPRASFEQMLANVQQKSGVRAYRRAWVQDGEGVGDEGGGAVQDFRYNGQLALHL